MPLIILGIAAMTNACLLHVCFIHYRMKTKTTIATKSEHNLNGVCSHDYQIRSADSEKTEIFSAGKENFTRQMSFFSLTSCTITLLASILTAFHYPPYVIALVSPLVFSLLSLTKPNLFYIFHNSAEMFYILLPTLLYGLISGSNSFILNETQCLLFLSNALVIFLVVYGGRSTTFKLSTSLYSVALIAGCNFISRSFIQHPESEELNPILEPLSSLTQDVAHQRLLLTAICLVAFVLLTLKNLFRTENLNSQYFNLVSTWFTAALPVCALCIILFWLQSLQSHSVYEAQSDRIKVLFPRTVYLIVVLGFALFLCEPILVHVQRIRCSKVPQISLEQFDPETDPAKLIPQIAKTLFPSSPSASKNGSAKHNWKFKKGNARQHNGVVQQNGSLKTAHVENSEESSRSSSVSNLSKRSRNSTLTQSSAVANNAHQHSLPKQPVMGARKFFHVVGLSSTALASWHLVSTPAIILLYLLVGNGSSLAFSIMILHAQALCQIATTAMHQKEEETQSSNTVSSQVENNGRSSQLSSNHQSEPRVTTKLKVETEERLNVDGGRAFDPCAVVSFVGGVAISLLGSYYFYVTGHQLSIASIRFETGYIGFLKDFQSFIVPGFLVVCNTFCAQIAALFFIPMIIYSRFSGSNCHPNTPATAAASVAGGAAAGAFSPVGSSVRSKLDLDSSDGDFWTVLLHNGDRVNRLLLVMFAAFSLTHAIKLCVTMACTSVLRLHLMAYRVFVPNLLFQAVAFLVVLIVQLLLALAHKWIMFRTNTFLTQLNSRR
ncbi:uncharacterized protein LOC134847610 isoform X2 [Symsagittifera roscoffensis]|uniref:uncharacterized protein LOC134847610 isoform X2 n=1 Tax=Symsagittifera roscoffensis TaxID=84072 RepID=UPI00307BC7E9